MIAFIPNVFKADQFQHIKLIDAIESIKNGTYKARIEQLRTLLDDDKQYKQAKVRMPSWAFNGEFNGSVCNDGFIKSSGLFHFDIDGLASAERAKAIISKIKSCVFCFISPSGNGLKGALRIDPNLINNDADFKRAFSAVNDFFECAGFTLDLSCKDVRRPCFVSYDPDVYYNLKAEVFPIVFDTEKPNKKTLTTQLPQAGDDSVIIERIINALNSSVPGERHNARLKVARYAGGCIAGGLINEQKAVDIILQISDQIADGGSTSRAEIKTIMGGIEYGKLTPINKINVAKKYNMVIEDDEKPVKHVEFDLLRHVDHSSTIYLFSKQVSAMTNIPINTVFLMGLAVFSSVACRRFCVTYRYGDILPIGMYAIAEHPPGSAKSWCISNFQRPFTERYAHLKAKLLDQPTIPRLFVTNTTPEALEQSLINAQGCFSAVSSEQGLIDSMMGNSYGGADKKNNNDLALNGFDGQWMETLRISRAGYSGHVVGSICCFAQQGTIETILNAGNGTGLSERFLYLSEQHNLGTRDHHKQIHIDHSIVKRYADACGFIDDVIESPLAMNDLAKLKISDDGHRIINDYRNSIEPFLVDGGKYSNSILRGAAGKANIQIMKVAAILHLLNNTEAVLIDDASIVSAIGIINDLLEMSTKICTDKEIIGEKAEQASVLDYFSKRGRNELKTRDLKNALRMRKPFLEIDGRLKMQAINTALKSLCERGILAYSEESKSHIII